MKRQRAAHKLVFKVAQGIAGELFEGLMKNNELFAAFKEGHGRGSLSTKALESRFISLYTPLCIDAAKRTLSHLLGRPDLPEAEKEIIAEALVLHNSIPMGRGEDETLLIAQSLGLTRGAGPFR